VKAEGIEQESTRLVVEAEMPNVPKIVRNRLGRPSPARLNHPEADMLTAYSEQSLPKLERAIVLEHLSRCGECREIVALALPSTESIQALPKAASPGWFAWPTFRWGFALSGLAAIAIFGFMQYQRHNVAMMALKTPPAPVMKAKTEPLPAVTDEGGAKAQDRSEGQSVDKFFDSSKAQTSPQAKGLVSPAVPSPLAKPSGHSDVSGNAPPPGPAQPNQSQQQNAYAYQAVPTVPATMPSNAKEAGRHSAGARVPVNSGPIDVQSQAAANETKAQDLDTLVVNQVSSAPLQERQEEAEVERAKPALNGVSPKAEGQPVQVVAGFSKSVSAVTPRWTINSAGGLQRSFDQGATWQNVYVNSGSQPNGASANSSLELSAAPYRARANDSPKAAKQERTVPVVFRTVAATGADVWAGGASGLLYHSSDAGEHWTHVIPSAAGVPLTGDILTMDFPDTLHGKIATSTSEVWSTSDGGHTWEKQ
jgi:hypothetical protein